MYYLRPITQKDRIAAIQHELTDISRYLKRLADPHTAMAHELLYNLLDSTMVIIEDKGDVDVPD